MGKFTVVVHDSINAIPRRVWDTVWPPKEEGYAFYRAQEEARLEGFHFAYVVISVGHTVVLLAPLFVTRLDPKLIFSGIARKLLVRIHAVWPSFLMLRALFCGSPTAEKGIIAIHPDYRGNAALLETLDHTLLAYAKKSGASLVYCKDIADADLASLAPLTHRGYVQFAGYPMTVLPITFPSVAAYVRSLSPGMRKNVQRKINEVAKRGGVEISIVHSVADCIDDVYALYENTYANGREHFEHQNKEFFLACSRSLSDDTHFFLYRVQHKLIGFNLCLSYGDTLIGRYLGFDYAVSREYNLYYLSFLTNISWCIAHNKKEFVAGAGAYATKERLGMKPVPLHLFVKLTHPLLNKLSSPVIRILRRDAGDSKNQAGSP